MNAGEQTIQWLFEDQLRVDREWSVKRPTGFTWWADHHAQTIDVIGSETNEEGETAYLVSVRTDFLRNFKMTDKALAMVNALLMGYASMAGPVFDEHSNTLSLCSLVRIHESIWDWMSALISMASVLQIAEARIMAKELATHLGAESAESGHPVNGERPSPDELAEIVANLIAPVGKQACKWHPAEFEQAVGDHLEPMGLQASSGFRALTVEFPFGNETSLFRVSGQDPHPRYGNGLLLIQSFRSGNLSELKAMQIALSLNSYNLAKTPAGYGFGSYCSSDGCIHFTTFLPNAVHREGLLPSLCYAAAERAEYMSNLSGALVSTKRS
jgi:hypothetical protein